MKKRVLLILILWTINPFAFVIYENTKIWDQNSITFHFLDGTVQQKHEVKRFAKLWQRYTGIKFHYSNNKPSKFTLKKHYTITFKGSSNQSHQGAINGMIHLGDLSENIIARKSTILHEFGHMLGLGHEHQRKDRPSHLNNDALIENCIENQKQERNWCKENFSNINSEKVFIESAYDSSSIMHYALKNITGQNSLSNHGINTLSYTDKYYVAMLYNQNISDKTLQQMHQQDIWNQQKFEKTENAKRELAISKLQSSSCKTLKYNIHSDDGKFCENGFMIIGKDNFSFPETELKTCFNDYSKIKNTIAQHKSCQLTAHQLSVKREKWSLKYSKHGQCKRLDTNVKNNQEYYCKSGYSFVTINNDMIGNKTECFSSKESVFEVMKTNKVCNMDDKTFHNHQINLEKKLNELMKTAYCEVVNKKYEYINCPTHFEYTIINKAIRHEPIDNKCFASKYQAINAMKSMPICQS